MPRPSTKEQIIDAGVDLMWRQGYTATGIQDIARSAGVPKGSFYNHFASKEQFAIEAINRYGKQPVSSVAILLDEDRSPPERLRAYFDAQIALVRSWDFRKGCLLGNLVTEVADHSPVIRDRLSTAFAGWTAALAQVIGAGQRAGEIPATPPAEARARFLLDAWEGAVLRARVDGDSASLATFRSFAVETALR